MFCFFIINVRHQANMLLPLRLFLDMEISLSLSLSQTEQASLEVIGHFYPTISLSFYIV